MPIYEYRCKQCGSKFEKLVKLSTKTSEIECPKCGAQARRKIRVAVWDDWANTSSGGSSAASRRAGRLAERPADEGRWLSRKR